MIRAAMLIGLMAAVSPQAGQATPGKLLFEDDFARADLAPKWKVGKGFFEVKDGVVYYGMYDDVALDCPHRCVGLHQKPVDDFVNSLGRAILSKWLVTQNSKPWPIDLDQFALRCSAAHLPKIGGQDAERSRLPSA